MTGRTLRARCPNCSAVYRVQVEHVGKRARCARCKVAFEVDLTSSAAAVTSAAAPSQFRDWEIGETILDLYEVRELVGEGAFGRVYRLFHRDWQLDLAVKSPNRDAIASPEGIELLEREAETWVQLGLHPHTVSCYYVRRVDDIPRVFAEYVSGGDLKQWIGAGRLYAGGPAAALARILDIAIQFAWGLDHAHEHRVIHQDVKPANLMLTPEGLAKVADFGLAHAKGVAAVSAPEGVAQLPRAADDTILVEWGGCTPRYASPEQMAGASLTRRTDVWSWGASLLEMFQGECTWTTGPSAGEHLEAYLGESKERDGLPPMPAPVADLLTRCFNRGEHKRPHTFQDVASELIEIFGTVCGRAYARPMPNMSRDVADNLNNRAISLVDLGRNQQAQRSWGEALRVQAHHPEATYNSGLLEWRAARLPDDELLSRLEDSRSAAAMSDGVGYLLAQVHLERGDCEAARSALDYLSSQRRQEPQADDLDKTAHQNLSRSRRCLRRLNHGAPVFTVALAQNADLAISAGADGALRVWSTESGEEVRSLTGHHTTVSAVAIDAAGNVAVSGGRDGLVMLWDLASGKALHAYEDHFGTVDMVCMSNDGRFALSGGEDHSVRLWTPGARECQRSFRGLRGAVTGIWIGPEGTRLVATGADGDICLWDVRGEDPLRTIHAHDSGVTAMCVIGDGHRMATGGRDGSIRLWNLAAGRCVKQLDARDGAVTGLEIFQDGNTALSSAGEHLRLWDLRNGRCIRTFSGHKDEVTSVSVRHQSSLAISGGRDGTVRLWSVLSKFEHRAPLVLCKLRTVDEVNTAAREYEELLAGARRALTQSNTKDALAQAREARHLPGFEQGAEAMALWRTLCLTFSHSELRAIWGSEPQTVHPGGTFGVAAGQSGRVALSGGADGTVQVWNPIEGRCEGPLGPAGLPVSAVDVAEDGRLGVSGHNDGSLKIWEIHSRDCLMTLSAHDGALNGAAISPDSQRVVTAGDDGVLALWDLSSGRCLRRLRSRGIVHRCVGFAPDGHWILAGGSDRRVTRWDVQTGEARTMGVFQGHTGAVTAVCPAPDGRLLITGGEDGALILWDQVADLQRRRLSERGPAITSVSISSDGEFALSTARDGRMCLYRMSDGQAVNEIRASDGAVLTASFVHNRNIVMTGGFSGEVTFWELDWKISENVVVDKAQMGGLRDYLRIFLERQRPYEGQLPGDREPTEREVAQALSRQAMPIWAEQDFAGLMATLHFSGFSSIAPDIVRAELRAAGSAYAQVNLGDATETQSRKAPISKSAKPRSKSLRGGHANGEKDGWFMPTLPWIVIVLLGCVGAWILT